MKSNWINCIPEVNKKEYLCIEDFPEGCYGFVYLIKNVTKDTYYIGQKQLKKFVTTRKAKRDLTRNKDGSIKKNQKPTYKKVSENNWLDYLGSKKVKDEKGNWYNLIEKQEYEGDIIKRYIIRLAFSKNALTLGEIEEQVKFDVLRDDKSMNDNIIHKLYRKDAVSVPIVNFNTKLL